MTDIDTAAPTIATSDTIIALAIALQAHVPALLIGPSGSGKTKTIYALSRVFEAPLWTVLLSVREPTDQGGMPYMNQAKHYYELLPGRWAQELIEKGWGWVFFDELNTAQTPVQASALRVVDEGYSGDAKLPDDTSFVAACMPHRSGSGTNPLISSFANRWAHFTWAPTPEEKIAGRKNGYPPPVVPRIAKEWREGIDDTNVLIAMFHEKKPMLIHAEPDDPAARGRAWPSDRTWTMAAKLVAAARGAGFHQKSAVTRILVEAAVGKGASAEFITWWVNLDLRDPEEYIADSSLLLPERQDKLLATLGALAHAAARGGHPDKERTLRQRAAWRVIGRVCDMNKPDLCVPAGRVLFAGATEEFMANMSPEVRRLSPLLERAGMKKKTA